MKLLLALLLFLLLGKALPQTVSPADRSKIDATAKRVAQELAQVKLYSFPHGMYTDNVVATRYSNSQIGFNIGFVFLALPQSEYVCHQNPDNIMCLDIFMILAGKGGYVVRGGPELLVSFRDVTDKASANKKLKELLPELTVLITHLQRESPGNQPQ